MKDENGLAVPEAGPLTLRPGEILPVVEGAPLTPHIALELGVTRILGMTAGGGAVTLVVYGRTGDKGEIQFSAPEGAKTRGASGVWRHASGGAYRLTPTYQAVLPAEYRITVGGESVRILAMSDALADHTWFVPVAGRTRIVCGPAYVGDVSLTGGRLRMTTERGLSAYSGVALSPYATRLPTRDLRDGLRRLAGRADAVRPADRAKAVGVGRAARRRGVARRSPLRTGSGPPTRSRWARTATQAPTPGTGRSFRLRSARHIP